MRWPTADRHRPDHDLRRRLCVPPKRKLNATVFPPKTQLAAEAGVSPVTHASGRSRGVVFRWACNHRLRRAITCFADNSRHASAWAADLSDKARKRGCKHQHAIRVLARAWVRDPAGKSGFATSAT